MLGSFRSSYEQIFGSFAFISWISFCRMVSCLFADQLCMLRIVEKFFAFGLFSFYVLSVSMSWTKRITKCNRTGTQWLHNQSFEKLLSSNILGRQDRTHAITSSRAHVVKCTQTHAHTQHSLTHALYPWHRFFGRDKFTGISSAEFEFNGNEMKMTCQTDDATVADKRCTGSEDH